MNEYVEAVSFHFVQTEEQWILLYYDQSSLTWSSGSHNDLLVVQSLTVTRTQTDFTPIIGK